MKRWISTITIVLPLLLASMPVVAQNNKGTPKDGSSQIKAQVLTSTNTQPLLIPLSGTDQIQLQLVRCSWFDCPLAQLILPASTFVNQWQLQFDNTSLSSVTVLNSTVVARNTQASYQITGSAISLPKVPQSLPANQIVSLPLTIDRSAIPPDNYSGAIYLTLANQSNRLILPLNIRMKTGPLLPLLVLLAGIVIGRLFKDMQERGEPQSNALKAINRLAEDLAESDPEDQKILNHAVSILRKDAYREKLETITPRIETIKNRLEALNKLRVVEKSLEGHEQHPKFEEVKGQIAQARDFYLLEEDVKAEKLAEKIVEIVPGFIAMMGSEPSEESDKLNETATDYAAAAKRASVRSTIFEIETTRQDRGWQQFQRSLIFLSGLSDQIRAEATFWLVRPLLSLLLLLGLSAVGFNTLYIEKGETFGARPFPDYLGLILWGISADVASRNLSSLQGKKESEGI